MTRKALYTTIFLLFLFGFSFSQNVSNPFFRPEFVHCSGNVEIIDSQYCLILKVSITGRNSITVKKIRWYNDKSVGSERLYIQKIIRGSPIFLTSGGLTHPVYDPDFDKLQKLDSSHGLIDTILLDNFVPFELGSDYLVTVEIDYSANSNSYIAAIKNIPFKVLFLPPKSMYE